MSLLCAARGGVAACYPPVIRLYQFIARVRLISVKGERLENITLLNRGVPIGKMGAESVHMRKEA